MVTDIHGNLTAFEAVLADLRKTSPDLVLHGGDLSDSGSSPVEIVDRIRDLGWGGVMGNTDEMLVRPQALEDFASRSTAPAAIWNAVREIAGATRAALGQERLAWLAGLPAVVRGDEFVLVHASPESCWNTPSANASDAELLSTYGALDAPTVAHGHTHLPSVRRMDGLCVVECGSVGLPYDGDQRASYLLLDGTEATIRRVEYDVEKELKILTRCGLPGAAWTAKVLRTGSPQMP